MNPAKVILLQRSLSLFVAFDLKSQRHCHRTFFRTLNRLRQRHQLVLSQESVMEFVVQTLYLIVSIRLLSLVPHPPVSNLSVSAVQQSPRKKNLKTKKTSVVPPL
jgi:hypothetical protein